LEKLHNEWNSWKSKSKQLARQLSETGMEGDEQHVKEITENYMKELHLLTQALVLKKEGKISSQEASPTFTHVCVCVCVCVCVYVCILTIHIN